MVPRNASKEGTIMLPHSGGADTLLVMGTGAGVVPRNAISIGYAFNGS